MHILKIHLIFLPLWLLTQYAHGQVIDSVAYQQDTLEIVIESFDLSEDMSVASSGNDELIFVAYQEQPTPLAEPVFTYQTTLDQQKTSDTLRFNVPNQQPMILFLVERDSDKDLASIEPILRIYAEQITEAYHQMDYKTISKYLGDEDILGIKTYAWSQSATVIELKRRHKLDKYHYKLTINSKK